MTINQEVLARQAVMSDQKLLDRIAPGGELPDVLMLDNQLTFDRMTAAGWWRDEARALWVKEKPRSGKQR